MLKCRMLKCPATIYSILLSLFSGKRAKKQQKQAIQTNNQANQLWTATNTLGTADLDETEMEKQ